MIGDVIKYEQDNIDTAVIIPGTYLKIHDYNELATHAMEGLDPDFPSKVIDGDFIVAGKNFGCGSSREHAPWALLDFGITCVISSSYADIFYNNCFKNGILPIVVSDENIKELSEYSNRKEEILVNLPGQKIIYGNKEIKFNIDQFKKKCLIEGLDDIALSLEKSEKILSFEKKLKLNKPWIFND